MIFLIDTRTLTKHHFIFVSESLAFNVLQHIYLSKSFGGELSNKYETHQYVSLLSKSFGGELSNKYETHQYVSLLY